MWPCRRDDIRSRGDAGHCHGGSASGGSFEGPAARAGKRPVGSRQPDFCRTGAKTEEWLVPVNAVIASCHWHHKPDGLGAIYLGLGADRQARDPLPLRSAMIGSTETITPCPEKVQGVAAGKSICCCVCRARCKRFFHAGTGERRREQGGGHRIGFLGMGHLDVEDTTPTACQSPAAGGGPAAPNPRRNLDARKARNGDATARGTMWAGLLKLTPEDDSPWGRGCR